MATPTTEEITHQVQESLKDSLYACSSLTILTGGTANFLYRGTLITPLENGSKTVVVKHTEGYLPGNRNFQITATRCDYEQTILTSLDELAPVTHQGITVQTPHLYKFFSATNTQIYSDLPSSTELKSYNLKHTLTKEQCSLLGYSIGLWAKKFHSWGAAPEQTPLRAAMKGNSAMKDLKYWLNYTNLVGTVEKFPEILEGSKDVFEAVAEDVKAELDNDEDAVLIHGDFWAGNVLLANAPFPTPSEPLKIYIIDWELSQVSSLAFDLGQMFAELFELKHFKNIDAGVWLIEVFMDGYGKIGEDLAFRVAVHVGAHLICWGSSVPGWGTRGQVERVVEIGRGFVVEGWKRNKGFFEGGPLESLFR